VMVPLSHAPRRLDVRFKAPMTEVTIALPTRSHFFSKLRLEVRTL
jgi:hypothetical protein